MKLAFIINGSVRKLDALVEAIHSTFSTYSIEVFISEYAQHYTELVHKALHNQISHLIFVGGDGTINEGINAFINFYKLDDNSFDWVAIAAIKLAVYPAGSGNDFVKSLYKFKIDSLFALKSLIDSDRVQLVDVGLVNYMDKSKLPSSRFFINITDVGVGGDTVQRKENVPKWLGANFSYMWAITTSITQYKPIAMTAVYDGYNWTGKAMSLVVANGRFFGNGLCVAPDAHLDSGIFELTIVGDISLVEYLKNLGKIKNGIKIIHPEVHYLQAKEIDISSSNSDLMTIDMDGEFIGYAPLNLNCLSKKLTFLSDY
ncbi:MAG TPA: YegS/Rv2252/BmrU family lipid kinase [Chitinophagales bacterium]|nr:YegS/Rv2252/BmrU family lipid kinase [Chitinophagales bacterium]MCB9075102.1 YegS/Rv2252/BmrU family lipid kinase [Chitinophagales bacterium]HMU97954.1 YegS/Rv2252/BmrU family lipid kinase [Chitinophagales bacterium]HMV02910.1 YegS/Rv2252/BmrU family lipid kinase [Chitinophagales bacterium]HMW93524.1 YegS/Rv2252/BmrU family lipid kinase [Chitinophagales bacterium]